MSDFRVNSRKDRTRIAALTGDVTVGTSAGTVTGLSVHVEKGTYFVEAEVWSVAGSATGMIYSLSGTATTTNVDVINRGVVAAGTQVVTPVTALADAASPSTTLRTEMKMVGSITVSVAGTITVNGIANANPCTAKGGSYLKVTKTANA